MKKGVKDICTFKCCNAFDLTNGEGIVQTKEEIAAEEQTAARGVTFLNMAVSRHDWEKYPDSPEVFTCVHLDNRSDNPFEWHCTIPDQKPDWCALFPTGACAPCVFCGQEGSAIDVRNPVAEVRMPPDPPVNKHVIMVDE